MSMVATDEDLVNRNLKEQAQAVWQEIYDQYKRCDSKDHNQLKYLQGFLECCGIFAGYSKLNEFRVLQKIVKSNEEKLKKARLDRLEKKLPPVVEVPPPSKPKSVKKKKK